MNYDWRMSSRLRLVDVPDPAASDPAVGVDTVKGGLPAISPIRGKSLEFRDCQKDQGGRKDRAGTPNPARTIAKLLKRLVGDAGIEPATPAV